MRTARRFVNGESGATMALALIMVVVLGVMGAGLVAFATKDLATVVEENRGQAAFGVADAGIEAAKRQLKSDCLGGNTCSEHYDGDGDGELQWSATEGGLLLKDLDGDGAGGTPDNVNVKIRAIDSNSFRAVSTGTMGANTRKIEANFEGSGGGGSGGDGGNITFPSAWTPSNIWVKGPDVKLNKSSLFSAKNIIINGITTVPPNCNTQSGVTDCYHPWTNFQRDYDNDQLAVTDTINPLGGADNLGLKNWYSPSLTPPGNWNVVGRLDDKGNSFSKAGFAAEGLVCGTAPTATPPYTPSNFNCDPDDPNDSIADGRYAYDKTTGSRTCWTWDKKAGTGSYSMPCGQGVRFEKKPDQNSTDQDTNNDGINDIISYPFPTDPAPGPERLKKAALGSDTYYKALESCSDPCNTFYRPGAPSTLLTWDQIESDASKNRVVFIDAQNHDLTYDMHSSQDGILVAWCGNLRMTNTTNSNAIFNGIVLAMQGDGAALGNDGPAPTGSDGPSSTCGEEKGVLTTDNVTLKAWLYSNNTSDTNPGIQLGQNTTVFFMPGGTFNLLDLILQDPIMTSIDYKGWRELYE